MGLEQIAKAATLIANQDTEAIIEQFELTETGNGMAITMVRGWLMDGLERRNPAAFEAWLSASGASPRKFFL